MSSEILNLQPSLLWKHFYSLTQIPRCSKHEKAVVEFVANFGKNLGLKTHTDAIGNVIIQKPATTGMENRKGVILQGHLDMVPQKNSETDHDFVKDPIQPYVRGEWVAARGTTLGADNGIGVAAAMAVLEDKTLKHGPLEVLLTVDEETGMTGAFALKPNLLKGHILMNLDSEEEGELYVGCAGGLDTSISFNYADSDTPRGLSFIRVFVRGLRGGHSGLDINLGRANAIKLLSRLLYVVEQSHKLWISNFDGGSLRNAIPREAMVEVGVEANQLNGFIEIINEQWLIIAKEFKAVEPNMAIEVKPIEEPKSVFDSTTQGRIIRALFGCPNGVIRMSDSMPGLVETSTNLARAYSSQGTFNVQCLLRSSIDSAKEALGHRIAAVFELAGARVSFGGAYPGWRPNAESEVLRVMKDVYTKHFGKSPGVRGIHAGLECGILGGAYPSLDMISFGPTISNPHSPDEAVRIDTVGKFWKLLTLTLSEIPLKH